MIRRKKRKAPPHAFKKGNPGGPGRPRKNPLQRAIDKEIKDYAKQHAASFKEACENMLPLALARAHEILERKGVRRENAHVRVLDLLADRVHGRPPIAITGPAGGPIAFSFEQLLKQVDGAKGEKFGSAPADDEKFA